MRGELKGWRSFSTQPFGFVAGVEGEPRRKEEEEITWGS
jgi:hypothetical protein